MFLKCDNVPVFCNDNKRIEIACMKKLRAD